MTEPRLARGGRLGWVVRPVLVALAAGFNRRCCVMCCVSPQKSTPPRQPRMLKTTAKPR